MLQALEQKHVEKSSKDGDGSSMDEGSDDESGSTSGEGTSSSGGSTTTSSDSEPELDEEQAAKLAGGMNNSLLSMYARGPSAGPEGEDDK